MSSSTAVTMTVAAGPTNPGNILYIVEKSRFRCGPGAHFSFPEPTESACGAHLRVM